jgi:hypothetical protein
MKILFLLFGSLLSINLSVAQKKISGSITDDLEKPLKGVSVLLLHPKDSSLILATLSSTDGSFIIENVSAGIYLISMSIVNHKTAYQPLIFADTDVVLKRTKLFQLIGLLREVTVTSRKPLFDQRPDKLVMDIENSATSVGTSALDAVRKLPGIIVNKDNKISLVGKSKVMILIDGRTTQYEDVGQVLRDLTSANISKIELITNPGAKYDAAGGAIINIILKKNANLGTNAAITLTGGMGLYKKGTAYYDRDYYSASPGININHRKGKINIFGNYNLRSNNDFGYIGIERVIDSSRFVQTNYQPFKFTSHSYKAGIDYYANKKNTFGISVTGFLTEGKINAKNNTLHTKNPDGSVISNFKTLNDVKLIENSTVANINWNHSFDSVGRELTVNIDYSKFKLNNNSNFTTEFSNGTASKTKQIVDNPLNFAVCKIDYVHPIFKKTKLEIGAKSSLASINNYLSFYRNTTFDSSKSNDFIYKENINALYLSLSTSWAKWQVTAGLRTEQTVAKGKVKGIKLLNRNYWQLFPSLFITRKITANIATVLQYSRRVDRPSFQQQNPFSVYLDSLTYTQGNPFLKPQTTDAYKLSLTYQSHPLFSASYNKTKDVIFENAPKQQGNITFTTAENLATYESAVFELNFPIQLGKKINGFGGSQIVYNHYKANYLGGNFDKAKWNLIAYAQIEYQPAPTWSIELSGFYMTKTLSEFLLIKPMGTVNIGLQHSVFDKKGKFTLNFNDIFFSQKMNANILYEKINLQLKSWGGSRTANLSFTYSFGNQKLKAARERNNASDEEAKRVKLNKTKPNE